LLTKEPLIKSLVSRVAAPIRMMARSAVKEQ
jgi:hypothetical protein